MQVEKLINENADERRAGCARRRRHGDRRPTYAVAQGSEKRKGSGIKSI